MNVRLLLSCTLALLAAGGLAAQVEAPPLPQEFPPPPPPLSLWVDGAIPTGPGHCLVACGTSITLGATFSSVVSDYVLLATRCDPGAPVDWVVLASGPVPKAGSFACHGVVRDDSPECSFMLVLAGYGGAGWWYFADPLVVDIVHK